jgi:transposase-like protein
MTAGARSSAERFERGDETMGTPTLDEVLELARRLPIADQQRLVRLLHPPKTIEQLAEEQGIKPGDWKIAAERAKGVWPADESIDDFLAFLRESRKDRRPPRDFGDIDDEPIPGPGIIDRGNDAGPESRTD